MRIDRRSIFYSEGHTVTTTAEQDYNESERREIRKTFLSMFEGLPRDVRIVIELGSIQYHGQTATVTAQWKYDIVGHATRLSRPYKNRSPGSLILQMLRVGDSWLVTDFSRFGQWVENRCDKPLNSGGCDEPLLVYSACVFHPELRR